MTKVHIDAGHGGKDPGATGNGLREKDITLSVSLAVGKILQRHGVQVSYSRTKDVFLSLSDRAKQANNNKSDLFVSIHTNAFTDTKVQGLETFSYPNSKNGAKLAKNIQDSILNAKLYNRNRGTKTANFAVLRQTKMPAALVELGFITNIQDAAMLKSRQNEFANAVAKGILSYLGVKYVPEATTTKDGYYRVIVGSYQNKKNAEAQQERLKKAGFDSFLHYYQK